MSNTTESKILIKINNGTTICCAKLYSDGHMLYNNETYTDLNDLVVVISGCKRQGSSYYSRIYFADDIDEGIVIYYDDIISYFGAGSLRGRYKLEYIYCLLKGKMDVIIKQLHEAKLLEKIEEEKKKDKENFEYAMETLQEYLETQGSRSVEQKKIIISRLLQVTNDFIQKIN